MKTLNCSTERNHAKFTALGTSVQPPKLTVLSGWQESLDIGRYFQAQGNIERALGAYSQAIVKHPQHPNAYSALGHMHLVLGNWHKAIAPLQQVVSLEPTDTKAYQALRTATNNLKRLPATVSTPDIKAPNIKAPDIKALNIDAPVCANNVATPTLSVLETWQLYFEQAQQFQTKDEIIHAAEAYYQAIICNPYHANTYYELGRLHVHSSQWHEAIAPLQQAIALTPDNFQALHYLSIAYRNTENWQTAVEIAQNVLKNRPGMSATIHALEETLRHWYNALISEGNHLLETDKAKALSAYREAVRICKDYTFMPPFSTTRERRPSPRVLLIADIQLDQCLRYRVSQKIEQLTLAGFECNYCDWRETTTATNEIAFYDVVIFYRVPAGPKTIRAIQYAKAIKKVVFYEIDDLIFSPAHFPPPIESYGGQISKAQHKGLVKGTVLFQEAMRLCDLAIASTPALQNQMEKIVGKGRCFLHRNGLDAQHLAAIELGSPKVHRDYVSIFYGSGTKAHNSDFDELVAPALARLLHQKANVRLTLMGYLTLPSSLYPYLNRIDRVERVKDIAVYYEFLKQADITIAVLHPTLVNDCKSELKWFEAANFKIPTVVSDTDVYKRLIEAGKDGFIAANPSEWYEHLAQLVNEPALRQQMGTAAYAKAQASYGLQPMAENIRRIILSGIELSGTELTSTELPPTSGALAAPNRKKKVLIVNVFYPPQTIGGATRVVVDNVDVLATQYSAQYDISVFTTDEGNPNPYQILEYSHQGIPITKISAPMETGVDWQHRDLSMYDAFSTYLSVHPPDLIHFHCIQKLTASVVEAARDMQIPYIVTVHDAWWISDHQFLVNKAGEECSYRQSDPVVTAQDADDVTNSIQRKLYLRQQLNGAAELLAVSETFAELYRQNGFPQTKANRNGIQPQSIEPKQPSQSGRVRLAHIGGMAAHKGYFLFKTAVEKAALSYAEVIVINHAQPRGTIEHDCWNGTPVTFLPKFDQANINQLYSTIDVLVAPSMWPESFGLVTREAAAAGVWVVASDKGAIGEDIIPGKNGHICSVDKPDSLISILQEIDTKRDWFQKPRQPVQAVRTTDAQVSELVYFYDDCIL